MDHEHEFLRPPPGWKPARPAPPTALEIIAFLAMAAGYALLGMALAWAVL